MAEDRFSQIKNTESLCFLCLKKADQLCKKCEIPYCSQEHFNVHYDEKIDYCYPFRVMQRPEVSFCFSLTIRGHSITTWGQKRSVFVHAQGIKTVHAGGEGGQKMAEFFPLSC